MSIGVYPVVRGRTTRASTIFDHGKSLSHYNAELIQVSEALQVEPLMSFCSLSREEAIALMGQEEVEALETGVEEQDGVWRRDGMVLWTREPEWFPASEGLKTIRGLLSHLRPSTESPGPGDEDEDEGEDAGIVLALRDFETVLVEAERQGHDFNITCG